MSRGSVSVMISPCTIPDSGGYHWFCCFFGTHENICLGGLRENWQGELLLQTVALYFKRRCIFSSWNPGFVVKYVCILILWKEMKTFLL